MTIEIITGDTKYPAPFTHRVLILCHEKNIPYQLIKINTEKKPAWFLKVAPLGQVPVLRTGENIIFDSNAICEYLDAAFLPHLLPEDIFISAQHRSWVGFADELAQEIAQFVKQGNMLEHDLTRLQSLFKIFNDHLKAPYFLGENLTIVDIALISHVLWIDALEPRVLPFSIMRPYPKVMTWVDTMKQRASVRDTMGDNYSKHFIVLLQKYGLLPE